MDEASKSDNLIWITGGNPDLSHNRKIASGSFAEVHEVNLLVAVAHVAIQQSKRKGNHNFSYPGPKLIQVFARKIMRPFAQISPDDIRSEIGAVANLCKSQDDILGRHIVAMLDTGELPDRQFKY